MFLLVVSLVTLAQPVKPVNKQKKISYSIGLSDNPPLSYLNEQNQATGLIVDLFNEIAREEGFKIKWIFDEWNILLTLMKQQKLDMLTSVGYSKEREKFLTYSRESFVASWSAIYLPKGSSINDFLDLDNKTIAVLTGDINGIILASRCEKFEIECNFVKVKTYTELFKIFSLPNVDAIVSNNIAGDWYANEYNLLRSSILFNPTNTYVAVPKSTNVYLLGAFDHFIKKWKKAPNSLYYKVKSKWLTYKVAKNIPLETLYIIYGLSAFAILALFSAFLFRRQIKKRVNELSVRNQQFSQIINLVPHIIYVADDKGNILLANKQASIYFGMTQEEVERCKIDNISRNIYDEKEFLNDNNLSSDISVTRLKEIETTDYLENKYTMLISKMPFKGLSVGYHENVTVAVDITDIKTYQKRIMHMAHFDPITDLQNKTLFQSIIPKSIISHIKNNFCGAVINLDLDAFKDINDSHGHRIGDLLIKAMANRLKQNIDDNNVYHFGGDEFVIHMPNLHQDDIEAEKLVKEFGEFILIEISNPFVINDMDFQITASLGAVIYPRDGNTEEVLLQRSDTALNKAKKQGRNNLQMFDKYLEFSVIKNHLMETELRHAVNHSQFELYFQPILVGKTNKMIGSEALLRWNHPKKGCIGPNEFIETAEKIHLMIKIGYWVIEQTCQKLQESLANNKQNFIAVNISVSQLKDEDFYKNIHSMIQRYQILPNCLEFEITESVLMVDVDLSIDMFNRLKKLGIRISIDDFGTGYSSFSYLIKLPIDKIKIDQSFVKDLPQNKNSATVVRTIIKMAKELELSVLAEGIENKEQYDFLKHEGCDYFQGYYFHKPLKYTKLLEILD